MHGLSFHGPPCQNRPTAYFEWTCRHVRHTCHHHRCHHRGLSCHRHCHRLHHPLRRSPQTWSPHHSFLREPPHRNHNTNTRIANAATCCPQSWNGAESPSDAGPPAPTPPLPPAPTLILGSCSAGDSPTGLGFFCALAAASLAVARDSESSVCMCILQSQSLVLGALFGLEVLTQIPLSNGSSVQLSQGHSHCIQPSWLTGTMVLVTRFGDAP